jgi:hypothetical protein
MTLAIDGLSNGTYALSVGSPATGYAPVSVPSEVTIAGTSRSLNVSFVPSPTNRPPSDALLVLVALGLVAIVVVVSLLIVRALRTRRRPPPARSDLGSGSQRPSASGDTSGESTQKS